MCIRKPRFWRLARRFYGSALILTSLLMPGCLFQAPMTPYPSVARAPHPLRIPPDLSMAELERQYTVSPDRNPDGLGVFELIWPQSTVTLTVWELERAWERQEQIAYARSDEEQRGLSLERERFYRSRVVIKGMLISYFEDPVSAKWYQPEGIYLMDDRGRKFFPSEAGPGPRELHQELRLNQIATGMKLQRSQWAAGYPLLVFPGEALTRETRALFLYLAAGRRRVRFAWVFDPSYEPPGGNHSPLEGDEVNRFWAAPGN